MATELADGRPWVLLSGTLCTGAVFGGMLDALGVPAAARHVVELRHPQVEDYARGLIAATSPDAIICGFSLGALVAAHLADRLTASRMFLFGLNPHADDPDKCEGRVALAQDVATAGAAAAIDSRLAPFAGKDPDRAKTCVLSMANETGHLIGVQTALAITRPGAISALAHAVMPVTCFTGTEDSQAPLVFAQDAANAAPCGRAVALPGLGHYALLEDPALCARSVLDSISAR